MIYYHLANSIPSWLLYTLGVLVVLLSLSVCGLILVIISIRSNSVEKGKTKLPETDGDKNSKFGKDPDSINKNKIQIIEDKAKNGFIVKYKNERGMIAFAKTKEEANEIMENISKEDITNSEAVVESTNTRGVDGEMVGYTNDRTPRL